MIPYINIHSHKKMVSPDEMAIFNCDYDAAPIPFCSVGVHPWNSVNIHTNPHFIEESAALVAEKAINDDVIAIGEAGLDKLRGADIDVQRKLFVAQVDISEKVRKPLIIHQVKCVDEILEIHKTLRPHQRWIIHGYRNKVEQARQLMNRGIDLSFGRYYSEPSLHLAYECNQLWLETDEADMDIQGHYQAVADELGVDVVELKLKIYERAKRLSSAFCREL